MKFRRRKPMDMTVCSTAYGIDRVSIHREEIGCRVSRELRSFFDHTGLVRGAIRYVKAQSRVASANTNGRTA